MVTLNAANFDTLKGIGRLHLADGSVFKVGCHLVLNVMNAKGGGFITGRKKLIQRAVDADVAILQTSSNRFLGLVLGLVDGGKVAVAVLGPVAAPRPTE